MSRDLPQIDAVRTRIAPVYFPQHEIDAAKVEALVAHLRTDGLIPPVVYVRYGDSGMPLDGHHRMEAARILGRDVDAWVVDGEDFEDLDRELSTLDMRAEDRVFCGGIPMKDVASK